MDKKYQFTPTEASDPPATFDQADAILKLQETFGIKDGVERLDDLNLGFVLSVKGGILRVM